MLECVGVTKNFGDTIAVDEFNLTIPQGEVIALLGPSGCGKTTALRLIAGFSNPEAGSISIGGEPVHQTGRSVPPEKRRVGMVFQEGALFPHLTVEQNIAYGLPKDADRSQRVQEVVSLTGLDGLAQRMPHELSGGQQQRVALARALAPRPELLLLDEPFSNLDPGLREQVRRDVMSILRASGITAVFVTHDQEEAMYVGDRIAVMNRGKIEQQGTPEEIFHHPSTKFVAEFVGMVDFVPARWEEGRIVTALGAADLPYRPVSEGSLEVMVRPDCVDCHPSADGEGVITDREFRGAFYLYRVLLASGGTVRCLRSHTDEYPVGATVTVKVRDGHAMRPFVDGLALTS
jgi:iron(III) transport system ATP-binding protein